VARARYSVMNEKTALGFLANALDRGKGSDGDTGAFYPRSDAEDMSRGARFIPGEVTVARRTGKKVDFVTKCGPNCWYWEMPDGSRIYHYDPITYHQIGTANGREAVQDEYGHTHFKDGPGPCPHCGNPNTSGGTIKPKLVEDQLSKEETLG
jgi:hypothetical protein